MKVIKKLTETPKIREMFDYYYSLGENRSLQKVADEYNMCISTIKNYSAQFNWKNRIKELDAKINEEAEKELIKEYIKHRKEDYQTIRALIALGREKIVKKQLLPTDVQDIERLIKLSELFRGGVTERVGLSLEEKKRKLDEVDRLLGL